MILLQNVHKVHLLTRMLTVPCLQVGNDGLQCRCLRGTVMLMFTVVSVIVKTVV